MNYNPVTVLFETWNVITAAAPYLLAGFFLAGLIHALIPTDKVVRLLGQRNWKSVLIASVCGIPLPLCSCSVLPTAASIREKGASRGATTSFLISTPETGVDSIGITYGMMDLTMTIIRPVAAFITAMCAGLFVNFWGDKEEENHATAAQSDSQPAAKPSCCHSTQEAPKPISGAQPDHNHNHDHHSTQKAGCCHTQETDSCHIETKSAKERSWFYKSVKYAYVDLVNDLSKWLALGFVLSGMISVMLPASLFEGWVGQGFTSLVLMLVVSMPMYICATSSTPVAAALVAKGLSPGAAVVLLLAGPATNVAALPVLTRILGKRSTAIYVVTIFSFTLVIGMLVNLLYANTSLVPAMAAHQHHEETGIITQVSGAILTLLIMRGLWTKLIKPKLK